MTLHQDIYNYITPYLLLNLYVRKSMRVHKIVEDYVWMLTLSAFTKLNRNVLDVMVNTRTMTTCIETAILAIHQVHPCREIRDTIKEYLFFDIRTIAYANYLAGKRFKDFTLHLSFRFDCDIDEDGSLGPGYFAFWTTIPRIDDNGCGIRSIAEDNHAYSDERNRSSSEYEDIEPPQFSQFFCTVCGNYETLPKNMEITLFHRSLRDRLFCACGDDDEEDP